MSKPASDSGLTADAVANYLRAHPDFLAAYPEIANSLQMPREQGAAASLSVYQLHNLREKNRELETRLADLIGIAGENETLMQRVHALTLAVLRSTTVESTLRGIVSRLQEDFKSERVRVLVYGTQQQLPDEPWLVREPRGASGLPEFADFLGQQQPSSGRLSPNRLRRLFGAEAEDVRSAALMKIGDEAILAIGSTDPDRFQPGMGTLFLQMIAATVSAGLFRAREAA
jgi:uncharacterized protein YigA (DUF484 family)